MVRVQWDPERDANLEPLPWRSTQIGLGGVVVDRYVDEWIVELADITPMVELRGRGIDERRDAVPSEEPYPLPADIAAVVGAHVIGQGPTLSAPEAWRSQWREPSGIGQPGTSTVISA